MLSRSRYSARQTEGGKYSSLVCWEPKGSRVWVDQNGDKRDIRGAPRISTVSHIPVPVWRFQKEDLPALSNALTRGLGLCNIVGELCAAVACRPVSAI